MAYGTVNVGGSAGSELEVIQAIQGQIEDIVDGTTVVGNADKLDGKQAAEFANNRVITTEEELNNTDLESGIYSVEGVDVTFPSGNSNYFMLIINHHRKSTGYGTQIAVPMLSGNMLGVFYRNSAGTTWKSWESVGEPTYFTKTVPVAKGGTGATTAAAALSNLGGTPLITNLNAESDLNDVKTSGFYRLSGTTVNNAPGCQWGCMFVSGMASTVVQIVAPHTGNTLYMRAFHNSTTWEPWKVVGQA